MTLRIAAAVLAAGASTRMGALGPKALLPTADGDTFLERTVARCREVAASPILVVWGAHVLVAPAGARLVENAAWTRGQLSSLQAAIRALEGEPCDALLVALVDHPSVQAETFARLVETFDRARPAVVRPAHRGRRGHPYVIAASLFPELLATPDAAGARPVLTRHAPETIEVTVDDPAILQDLDTPADLG